MKKEIQNIKNQAIAQLIETSSIGDLEQLKIDYLGRKGLINNLATKLKEQPDNLKREIGILLNSTKQSLNVQFSQKLNDLKNQTREWFDPTIPGIQKTTGSLHLVTQAIEEITSVFTKIGFTRVRYPEIEWDWFSFGSLNFDPLHPARDDWETFFVDTPPHKKYGPMVLTPHTSSGQVREMKRVKIPPIRMINIAKCYRRESDTRHVPMLHQFEGLVVDKKIAITHLKGTLDYFARNFYGEGRVTRIRPYNFPFTEPSFEVDINCGVCMGTLKLDNGQKCKACKQGWHEIGGAGMVHPNVLRAGNIDPKKYSGFAFGWGVERVFMMKSGLNIPDVRLMYSPDLRFLRQF